MSPVNESNPEPHSTFESVIVGFLSVSQHSPLTETLNPLPLSINEPPETALVPEISVTAEVFITGFPTPG